LGSSNSPIDAIWCEQASDGSWISKAWDTSFPEESAAYVFDYVGATDDDALLYEVFSEWPVELDAQVLSDLILDPVQPKPFGDGVFVGDALEPIIELVPELLQPLEQLGYPALSSLSGNAITSGTFSQNGIEPVPTDGACITAPDFLNVFNAAFNASPTDGDLVDLVFEIEYSTQTEGCGTGCRERTWTASTTPWVYTCGAWTSTGSSNHDYECRHKFSRPVSATRSRVRKHRDTDCVITSCTQTRSKSGTQKTTVVVPHVFGAPCGGAPLPTVACACPHFMWFDRCVPTPWAPPCVWP